MTPEQKVKNAEYHRNYRKSEKFRIYSSTPEYKAKEKMRLQRYYQNEEKRIARIERVKRWLAIPGNREKHNEYVRKSLQKKRDKKKLEQLD